MGPPYIALVLATAAAAAVSWIRWRRTPVRHADYAARRDMAALLVLCAVGAVLVAVRARFLLTSPSFYVCSGLLLPIAIGALVFLAKLIRRYREEA